MINLNTEKIKTLMGDLTKKDSSQNVHKKVI